MSFPDRVQTMTIHNMLPPDAQVVQPSYNDSSTQLAIRKVQTQSNNNGAAKNGKDNASKNSPSKEMT